MERQRTGISFNSLTLRVPASLSNFFRFPREQESPTPPKERWDKGQTHYKPLITGTCALGEEEIGSRAQGDTATHGHPGGAPWVTRSCYRNQSGRSSRSRSQSR